MSTLLLVVLSVGVVPAQQSQAVSASTSPVAVEGPALAGNALQTAIHSALRHWARPADKDAGQAARELMGLFGQLQHDTQIAPSTCVQLQAQLRHRLGDLAAQIRRSNKDGRHGGPADVPTVGVPGAKADNLAQWGVLGQRGPANPQAMQGAGVPGAGGAAAPDDTGADLADLIQTTIAPASWERNGGLGSIYYWFPGRALAIRQTEDVHHQVGAVLGQLRQAGQ
jgi:hypothetical protein